MAAWFQVRWTWTFELVALGCLCATVPLPAQATSHAVETQPTLPSENDKRKAFDADAQRLVQLATDLKAELERSRKDELSVKVIRDADEIDRLARSARTRIH